MTKDGRAGRGGEHLVPCLEMPRQNVFIGVKTGKKHPQGHLVYLGPRDVDSAEILRKLKMENRATDVDRRALESFLNGLQAFKIGNVVSFRFTAPDACTLTKEAEHPAFELPNGKLP